MALTKVSRGLLSTGIVDNSNATAITIDSSENVGIGTSSCDNKVNIQESALSGRAASNGNTSLTLEHATDTGIQFFSATQTQLRFGDAASTAAGSIIFEHGTNKLRLNSDSLLTFATAGSERMRIDSSGNVGIAVAPPAWGAAYASVDVGTAASFWGTKAGVSLAVMSDNTYLDGSAYIARNTGAGSKYYQNAGAHYWDNAASVSAGAAQTNVERMRLDASGNLLVGTTAAVNSAKMSVNGNATTFVIHPAVDNNFDCGHPSYRWDDIRATNGTIQTSDRNEKQDIEALSDAEQRVAVAAKGLMRKFRWISSVQENGDNARIHFGIIAQDLQAAFEAEGLDAGRYAMFISDTWWETQTEVAAVEETEDTEAVEAYTRTDTYDTAEEAPEGATERTRLGVRYNELLAFIIAAI